MNISGYKYDEQEELKEIINCKNRYCIGINTFNHHNPNIPISLDNIQVIIIAEAYPESSKNHFYSNETLPK